MTLTRPEETFVHCDADLHELWCNLMGTGGFARRSLWMIFIEEDGRMSPVIIPVDDLPTEPDPLFTGNLATILEQVMAPPVSSVAFLLSRPGPAGMTVDDRRWARALRSAVPPFLAPWPVHLATTDRVRVFAPDDLIAA